jgi:hypothetical protein
MDAAANMDIGDRQKGDLQLIMALCALLMLLSTV